uniref:RNA binding protein n=1 Tax=Ascaris lumbricoides TaxID=6252 RepID=A0A0M3IEV8_ASCLU
MVECKKAQPKEVMLPVQLNKSRAAAARNLYGLGPEQLLAYASYLPRLGTYGANMLYPVFNGFQSYAPLAATSPPGGAAANSAANGGVARGFSVAAAQAAAAQQAVALEAAALYASVGGEPFPAIYPPIHHQIFNGFQSYAPLAATSPPGGAAANSAANGGVARGFSVAAAQAAAAQQAVALEAAALYASVGGEPFPAIYPPIHHQSAQMPHAFHKV